jgi:hypothetical protein
VLQQRAGSFLGQFEFLKAVPGHLDDGGFPGIFLKYLMAAFSLPIFLEISPARYRILASDTWVPLKSPVEYDASYSSRANLKIFLLVPCFVLSYITRLSVNRFQQGLYVFPFLKLRNNSPAYMY